MAVTTLTDGARTAFADPPTARVLVATITCLGRWGLAKTTLDDIAREAGVSRATVYRLFPGGKDTVVRAAVAAELLAFEQGLARRLDAVEGLEELVVASLTYATVALRSHPALQFLLVHEPEHVLPRLAFAELDEVLADAVRLTGPWLAPQLGDDAAELAAEWIARLVLSYLLVPSRHFDLGDEADARRFARTFLLPGLRRKAPSHG
jgi:AcrR family transcriptional regulator